MNNSPALQTPPVPALEPVRTQTSTHRKGAAVKRPRGGARSIPIESWHEEDFGGVFDGNNVWSDTELGGAPGF